MKRKFNKVLTLLVMICMLVSLFTAPALAAKWTLDSGVLTITFSNGDDYRSNDPPPWYNRRGEITSVVMKDDSWCIGKHAFDGCHALTSVTIPNSVNIIGEYAFASCSSLKSIMIPSSVTHIENGTFSGCSALESIYIPASIMDIGADAFLGDGALSDVYYGGTAETWARLKIAEGNDALRYATVHCVAPPTGSGNCGTNGGNNVKWKLDDSGLLTLSGKGDMDLYSGGKNPPWEEYKSFIVSVHIDEGITNLCYGFTACNNLKSIDIPASVEFLNSYMFSNSGIESINIAKDNKKFMSIDGIVFSKDGKTIVIYPPAREGDYVIPEGVTAFDGAGDSPFHCPRLTGITLPSTMTLLKNAAFYGCDALKWVSIPVSITHIGAGAFAWDFALKDVYYAGTEEQWKQIKIDENNYWLSDATIHYQSTWPDGLANFTKVNTYRSGKFTDVPAGDWYAESVKTAYELDLVKGESESKFSPAGSVNIAAAITLACRLHSIYHTGKAEFVQGNPWYQVYVDYAVENGIIKAGEYTNMGAKATREQYATIMSKALPDSALQAINKVDDDAVPDVKMTDAHAAEIYKLYRAGILTGSDAKGTFNPQSDIKRAEVAALVTRMADTSLRKNVTLQLECEPEPVPAVPDDDLVSPEPVVPDDSDDGATTVPDVPDDGDDGTVPTPVEPDDDDDEWSGGWGWFS